jgi:hypothetical protein
MVGVSDGDYDEYFRPVIEFKYWLPDASMFVPVRKR